MNLTFYRMDINGFQDRAFDGTSFTVRNAGNLRQQGFEFDGVAKPMRNLSLFASLAYLDSEFTDYPNAPACRDVRRTPPAQFPPFARPPGLEQRRTSRARPRPSPEVERPRRLRLDRRCRLERPDAGT